jgi:iron complex outermembrane receptor protein
VSKLVQVAAGRQSRSMALKAGVSLGVMVLALSASAAWAADEPAPTSEVSEIVVTGFRGSLEKSLNLKKESAQSTDTILAEDIGKFPDLNLSESIQRLPGVALARDAGEGRNISVRGLGPGFTRVRINGIEALTTTGSADAAGGTNRGRGFDFNVFASDLFNSITVTKSGAAETEEGSLGATVDLRTARPFDFGGFKLAASLQGSYNTLQKDTNPRAAFMISNTWGDGKFGALFSVAYTKRTLRDEGTSTVRWARGSAFAPGFDACNTGVQSAATCGANATLPTTANTFDPATVAFNAAYHPRFPRFDIYQDNQERLGMTLSLQWAPTDHLQMNFDALYADFKGDREEQYLEGNSFNVSGACTAGNINTSCGIADTNIVSGVIDSHNTLIKGTFNDVDLRVEDRFDHLDTKFQQYVLSGSADVTDTFKVNFMVGTSASDFQNPVQTTLTLDQFNVDGYSYDYSQGRAPIITYGNANLTNPGSWVLTGIRERPQSAKNTIGSASVDGAWTQSDAFTLRGGFAYKRYEYSGTEMRRSNGTTSNQEATIPAGVLAIPLSSYSGLQTFAGTQTLVPNLAAAVGALSLYDQTAFGGAFHLGIEPILGSNQGVKEKDASAWAQGDFRTEVLGMPLRGNFGIRFVGTDQTSRGYTFVGGAPVAISVNRQYTDSLPSMNVVLEPMDNFLIRFGAARVMSRPNLAQLAPSTTISVSGATRTVTTGNPNLDPFRATTYDLAFEWYFHKGALISVALFQKNIDSFITTQSTIIPFTGNPFGLPDSVATAACGATPGCSPSANWTFNTPLNTQGGTLKGFEINYQQPFTFLPGLLSHTGFIGNYTYVESAITYPGVAQQMDLTGLSRRGYNATLYYEDSKLSARVSVAYRSKYLTRVPGQEAGTDVDGTNATLNVDASVQYTINEHFKVTLEGVNLTDEYQDQYNDSSNRVSFYHHTGSEYLFGVRYSF